MLLAGVHVEDIVKRERLVLSDHNLWLTGSYAGTNAAHFNSLTGQLRADSVQFDNQQGNVMTRVYLPILTLRMLNELRIDVKCKSND